MIKVALSAAIGVAVVFGVVDAASFQADATEAAFLQFETGIATRIQHLTADVDPWLAQREAELLDLQKKEKELDEIYTSQRFYARPTPEGKAAIEKAKVDRETAWQKVNAKRREINAYKEKNPPPVFVQLPTGKVVKKKVAKKTATTKDPKAAVLAKELKALQAAAQQADEVYQRKLQAQKTASPEQAAIAKKLAVVKQKKAAVSKQIKQYKAKKSAKGKTAAAPEAAASAPKAAVAKAKAAGKAKKVVKGKKTAKAKKTAKKAEEKK